jgi:hypothetical protein
MDTTFMWLVISWLALGATLLGLMIFRKYMARNEDDFLHVSNATSSVLNSQTETAHRMDVIDRWITILLATTLIYGLIIGGCFLYQAWQVNSKPVV